MKLDFLHGVAGVTVLAIKTALRIVALLILAAPIKALIS